MFSSTFNYNVIVANMYETYNFLKKEVTKPLSQKMLMENYLFVYQKHNIDFLLIQSLKEHQLIMRYLLGKLGFLQGLNLL